MDKLYWTTEKRKVRDLVPYEYNPRILTEEKKAVLQASMEKFNVVEIPAINKDNIIIAGHQRVKVLMSLGRSEELIDVRVPNRMLTTDELKEYNITSNTNVGFWDVDILDEHFADIDLESLGLNVDDIIIPELEQEQIIGEEDDFDDELPVIPVSKEGDLYELNGHRLLCGDSTSEENWELLMGGKKADLIITDPPYNVDYTGGTKEALKIINDKQDDSSFLQFLIDFYTSVFSITKEGAAIYVFHADSEGKNFRQGLTDAGFKLSQCLIWLKNNFVMGRQDYHWKHEPILYGWKEGAAHSWFNDRTQSTILEFDKPSRNEEHPTMKPINILSYLICNSSKMGMNIVDGFLGSGSVLIASEQTKRDCFGMELDPRYCDVIVRRWFTYMNTNDQPFTLKRNGIELTEDELREYTSQEQQ